MPVVGRVDPDRRGDGRVAVGHRDLEAQPAAVRDGHQVVDGVQLAARVVRVVHAGDAERQLEPQVLVVAQVLRHLDDVLAGDVQGQLAAVDHDRLDRRVEPGARRVQQLGQHVDDLVEPAAVGPLARPGQHDRLHQPAEPGGVARAVHAEHALPDVDDLQRDRAVRRDVLRAGLEGGLAGPLGAGVGRGRVAGRHRRGGVALLVAHRSSPVMCEVGVARSAAASTSAAIRLRLPPSGSALICSCSSRIALISISGRGGQPGR